MIRLLLAVGVALTLSGCADFAGLAAALAKDNNAVCLRITTLYGSAEINRNHGCELSAAAPAVAVAK